MDALGKLSAARLMARRNAPYFGAALFGLVPREAPGLGTVGVTATMVMMYDPATVEKWSTKEIAAVLVHEISHVLRGHHRRGAIGDAFLWNVAGDLAINPDLAKGGWQLPADAVYPKQFKLPDNQTTEFYYNALRQMAESQKPKAGKGPASGKCGGCAGNPGDGEPDDQEGDTDGDGRSEKEIQRIGKQVAEDVRNAAKGGGQGSIPAGLLAWAEEQLKPAKIPWRQKLARLTRRAVEYVAGQSDYTYRRISRRQGGLGYGPGCPVVPALHSPVPSIAVLVDTSGSMSQKQLTDALSEVSGILTAANGRVRFMACDAEVHANQEVKTWRELVPLMKGGGGSSFIPAFDAIGKLRNRPSVLVAITDGYIDVPRTQPAGMAVIWVLVGSDKAPAAWGECVAIEEDGKELAA